MSDNTHPYDGVAVLAALCIILVAWVGIGSILSDSKDKDAAIAELKQQLTDAKRGIDFCQGRLEGYRDGRR